MSNSSTYAVAISSMVRWATTMAMRVTINATPFFIIPSFRPSAVSVRTMKIISRSSTILPSEVLFHEILDSRSFQFSFQFLHHPSHDLAKVLWRRSTDFADDGLDDLFRLILSHLFRQIGPEDIQLAALLIYQFFPSRLLIQVNCLLALLNRSEHNRQFVVGGYWLVGSAVLKFNKLGTHGAKGLEFQLFAALHCRFHIFRDAFIQRHGASSREMKRGNPVS